MAGREPEERVLIPTLVQGWRDVSFLHWRVDDAAVAAHLPDGLTPHRIDGNAWVSLIAFTVHVGPVSFPETNVRTYVVGPDGRDGIWFLAIEADAIGTTIGARLAYGAPYVKADMSVDSLDGGFRYRSPRTRLSVRVGDVLDEAERTQTVDELTGQWRGYTKHLGRILRTKVAHEPWPLYDAAVTDFERSPVGQFGVQSPTEPELVQWSPGVTVRLSRPRLG